MPYNIEKWSVIVNNRPYNILFQPTLFLGFKLTLLFNTFFKFYRLIKHICMTIYDLSTDKTAKGFTKTP